MLFEWYASVVPEPEGDRRGVSTLVGMVLDDGGRYTAEVFVARDGKGLVVEEVLDHVRGGWLGDDLLCIELIGIRSVVIDIDAFWSFDDGEICCHIANGAVGVDGSDSDVFFEVGCFLPDFHGGGLGDDPIDDERGVNLVGDGFQDCCFLKDFLDGFF